MTEDKKERDLYYEMYDIEWELLSKLQTLIDASWDSNTVKKQIEGLLKQYDAINHEIHSYEETKEAKAKHNNIN